MGGFGQEETVGMGGKGVGGVEGDTYDISWLFYFPQFFTMGMMILRNTQLK